MKKTALVLSGIFFLNSLASATCNTGYEDCWLNLEEVKNQHVVLCDAFVVPPVPMREYLTKVVRLDTDMNKVRFIKPPKFYDDVVRSDVLLSAPVCRTGKLEDFNHEEVKQSWSHLAITTDMKGVLMVYRKKSLLRRIFTLGLGSDREVIYVHPELYRLIREQPTKKLVN